LEYQAYLLRSIGDQINLTPLQKVALQPGISAVYRLTVRYHDRRARESVATLRRWRDQITLEIVYRGRFDHKPLALNVLQAQYEAFVAALHKLRFDQLNDQPNLPTYGVDLWLLERAAGSFTKSLILAPELARDVHAALVETVRTHLPEMLREVKT
jgi:hypothetical protein